MKAHLEISWKQQEGDGNWLAEYDLLLPIKKLDIRNESGEGFLRLPIGKTKVSTHAPGFPIKQDGDVEIPFRDGAHAKWDAETLDVEAWAVYGNRKTKIC